MTHAQLAHAPTDRVEAEYPYLCPVPDCEPPAETEFPPPTLTGVFVADNPILMSVPSWSHDPELGIQRTGSQDLPPPKGVAAQFAKALLEVLGGQRRFSQLQRHCAPEVYAGLRALSPLPGPAKLTSTHASCPADGVTEVAAVFRIGSRFRALAMRLEGIDGRWRIVRAQFG